MACTSCSYMFCWLCMGGPDEHPGSSDTHIAQCNSEEDVKAKGRMAQMEAAIHHDSEEGRLEAEWRSFHTEKYKHHKDMGKQTLLTKEDALAKIEHILRVNNTNTLDDFKFFFDALALQ